MKILISDKEAMANLQNQTVSREHIRFVSPVTRNQSHVQKAAKDECDINVIMERFKKTGVLPPNIKQNPQYGDFTEVGDYQGSLNRVMAAQEAFNALPARLRKRFNNDPQELLEFVSNPENGDEAVALGLATPRQQASDAAKQENAAEPKKSTKAPVADKAKGARQPKGGSDQ